MNFSLDPVLGAAPRDARPGCGHDTGGPAALTMHQFPVTPLVDLHLGATLGARASGGYHPRTSRLPPLAMHRFGPAALVHVGLNPVLDAGACRSHGARPPSR
ncbi:MAG TPA: hypothetical protein VLC55_04230, partial [Burkholderiales bacterium]|nr:hypothetical protein [Burkholderiales bacterium]